jgi:hypothetical protein
MKRLPVILLLLAALGTLGVLLMRPTTHASPGATISVNSAGDSNSRDGAVTLREAMLLATGDLPVSDLDAGECAQLSNSSYGPPCSTTDAVGSAPADTVVFDPAVFPPATPSTIYLGSALPSLFTGNDTVDGSSAGVIVDGGGYWYGRICFDITSAGNSLRGLQIYRCNYGVRLSAAASGNTIGGSSAGDRNVISGNYSGVRLEGGADSNVVKGNYIGTNAAGDAGFANYHSGVWIEGGHNNIIGGSAAGEGNVISANNSYGVFINGGDTYGNVLRGNYIGTNATGTALLPNSYGVYIQSSAHDNVVGGTGPGEGNFIAANNSDGVQITYSAVRNAVRANSIYWNGARGIENIYGGNTELAPPVIDGVGASVSGHTSPKCYPCTVEVFSDEEEEGRVYHGSTTTNDDATGTWTYSGTVSGPNITATVTDADGNTSEFSVPVPGETITPMPTQTPTYTLTPTPTDTPTPGPTSTPTRTPQPGAVVTFWPSFDQFWSLSPRRLASIFERERVDYVMTSEPLLDLHVRDTSIRRSKCVECMTSNLD